MTVPFLMDPTGRTLEFDSAVPSGLPVLRFRNPEGTQAHSIILTTSTVTSLIKHFEKAQNLDILSTSIEALTGTLSVFTIAGSETVSIFRIDEEKVFALQASALADAITHLKNRLEKYETVKAKNKQTFAITAQGGVSLETLKTLTGQAALDSPKMALTLTEKGQDSQSLSLTAQPDGVLFFAPLKKYSGVVNRTISYAQVESLLEAISNPPHIQSWTDGGTPETGGWLALHTGILKWAIHVASENYKGKILGTHILIDQQQVESLHTFLFNVLMAHESGAW